MVRVERGFLAASNRKTAIYVGFQRGTPIVTIIDGDYGGKVMEGSVRPARYRSIEQRCRKRCLGQTTGPVITESVDR